MSKEVSIILPTYNRADVLDRSINSVLEQTYENFELLIVDDGSTDGTQEIVERYKDRRIKYIQLPENQGAAAARNEGINQSNGEYVAFQDSDDVWAKSKLKRQIELLKNSQEEVGVVYCRLRREYPKGRVEIVPDLSQKTFSGWLFPQLQKANFISTQTAVVRRRVLEKSNGFDENLASLQDWELWLRLSKLCRFEFVDEQLVTAHVNENSLSLKENSKVDSRKHIVNKHGEDFCSDYLARQYFYIGNGLMQTNRPHQGRKYLYFAFRETKSIIYLISLIIALFGEKPYKISSKIWKHLREVR